MNFEISFNPILKAEFSFYSIKPGDHDIIDKREETLKQRRDQLLGSLNMHKNLMNKSHHQVVVVVEVFAAVVVVGFPACCCWVFMYFIGNGRGGVFDNNAV